LYIGEIVERPGLLLLRLLRLVKLDLLFLAYGLKLTGVKESRSGLALVVIEVARVYSSMLHGEGVGRLLYEGLRVLQEGIGCSLLLLRAQEGVIVVATSSTLGRICMHFEWDLYFQT
jgi:hypothetical protein